MSEFKTEKQVNYGWGLSLNMTGKAPAIAKRIFETYDDALAYVNDANDSAIQGLQLSVFNDTDTKKNGIYFVEKIGTGSNDGVITKVGDGSGVITVNDYNDAVAQATADNIGQLFYALNNVTEGDEVKYTSGLYVVTGDGILSKLGTQSADGKDYQGQIDGINARLSTVETTVGDSASGLVKDVADLKTTVTKNTEDITTVSGKVDTNAEAIESLKTAVGDAESGLTKKVNDLETTVGNAEGGLVKDVADLKTSVNGIDGKISDAVKDFKVKNVDADDKILALSDAGFISAKVSLAYGKGEGSSENDLTTKTYIKLLGKDNKVFSQIDASEFIKDGMLEKVELKDFVSGGTETKNGKYLVLTFNTEAGKEPIYLPVNDLVDTYTAGKGLALGGNQFSIKLKEGEKYLQLDADGNLVSNGIDDAISSAISGKLDTTVYQEYTGATETKLSEIKKTADAANNKVKDLNFDDYAKKAELKTINGEAITSTTGANIDVIVGAKIGETVVPISNHILDLSSLEIPVDGDDVEGSTENKEN